MIEDDIQLLNEKGISYSLIAERILEDSKVEFILMEIKNEALTLTQSETLK